MYKNEFNLNRHASAGDPQIMNEHAPSNEPQQLRGYVIHGHMPYARPGDTVLCILGEAVFHLNQRSSSWFLLTLLVMHGSVACATSKLKKERLLAGLQQRLILLFKADKGATQLGITSQT